jgi:purine-binding chemotaxis protein CheW
MSLDAAGTAAGTSVLAKALREEFDSVFARAPVVEVDASDDFLAIRVGEDPYALRFADIAGLYVGKTVTALPGSPPALLGVTGFRGDVVAVFDLGALVGAAVCRSHRWMVRTAVDARVGLAFDQFEGHVRAPRARVADEGGLPGGRGDHRYAVTVADVVRPIVRIPDLVDGIKSAGGPAQRSDGL